MRTHYTLAQITDCHLFADPNKDGYANINPYQTLQNVLAELGQYQPDCVLVTGDVSGDRSTESYHHFTALWKMSGIKAPLVGVAGNHDDISAWQLCFESQNDYQYLQLPIGQWRLHLLPSEFDGAKGRLKLPEMQKMFKVLEAEPAGQHIVALHHPLTNANAWMDKHNLTNAGHFIEQLPRANLRAVLHGHVHTERTTLLQGTQVFSCPSTCWQWANTKTFGVTEQSPGFRIVKLSNDDELVSTTHYLN